MPVITFDKFDVGLDRRKNRSVADANRMHVLTNAYVTTGGAIAQRAGIRRVATLEPGTVGLRAANGKLNTFYESGTITHANTLFQANKVAHPTLSQAIKRVHYADAFNGFLYCAIEYNDASVWHHYLDGTSPTHVADVNCPHSKAVTKTNAKIYGVGNQTVRYCKTDAPRDWTTANNAGFLPVGVRQSGSAQPTALSQFQQQLVVFFSDSAQVWDVDPDPALNTLVQRIYNLGTIFPNSPSQLSGDVFFLSGEGYRSLTRSQYTDNLVDFDVGSPIDSLLTFTPASDVESAYYSGAGQFWSRIDDEWWVYSFSKTSKLSAWSRYTFTVQPDAMTALDGSLYMRAGDVVYVVDEAQYDDDGAPIAYEVELPFLNFKSPGVLKQIWGVDAVVEGAPYVQYRYDPRTPDLITLPYRLSGDTQPGAMTPVELCATAIAPVFTPVPQPTPTPARFALHSLSFHYHELGPM